MNSSIKIALVAVVGVAAMTACTSAPAPKNNVAPQTSSSTPISETSSPPPPVVVTSVVTQTVTNPPQPQAVVKVDNRIGYGALKLGMSLDEVRAAGLTTLTWESDGDANCVADGSLAISKKFGIVRISLPADAKTSKGIGAGSTFAEVKAAYPDAREYRDGWSTTLSGKAGYAFLGDLRNERFADSDVVIGMKLTSSDADCAMAYL
ncbi:hypothetical protein ABZX92_08290 [Lentzea sp. NPDC006480]|uniref:hypothetical protein n=1 Tax=Lentzea sp. NPDC006480 TaxID=3157176 RepID=UPI0033ACF998